MVPGPYAFTSRGARSPSLDAAVLVVTADAELRHTTGSELRRLNIDVSEAKSGEAAIAAIRARPFDLALIDGFLPDIPGLEVVVALKRERIAIPWLLMSGRMTTPLAVEAMKLGALDAVDLPMDVKTVVVGALHVLSTRASTPWPVVPSASLLSEPKSAAERWASLVLRGCVAEDDLKTIRDWAVVAGTSYSALTASCRLVGIRPHDARDFLRMLRALAHAGGCLENLEHGLNVSDHRTLTTLFKRAGLAGRMAGTISLDTFIDRQWFIDPSCEPLRVLLKIIHRVEDARRRRS